MSISNYKSFRREQEREFNKLTKGYVVEEDMEFESMCNSYLSNDIKISDFDNYLNRSLFLDINESSLNTYFDESGNLIDRQLITEGWFNDILDKVGDKLNQTFNVAFSFFKSIVDKIKSFINNFLSKFSTAAEKMMDILSSLFDKIMSGLKYFGNFIKNNKKGLYSILVKISVSVGISATVSYLLSFFGPGWVASMGIKTGVSSVSKKLKLGDKLASKVVSENKIRNYSQFINEAEEVKSEEPEKGSVKKVAIALGEGIIKFFKILRKFKIAVLIFLGAIWIIGHMFSPFGNFLDPIFKATQMTHLGDVFKTDFVASASSIPPIKIDTNRIDALTINKVAMPNIKDDHNLGFGEIQSTSTNHLNTNVGAIKAGIVAHPKVFCEGQSKLINDLKKHIIGDDSDGINHANTQAAAKLTHDQIEKITGKDLEQISPDEKFEFDKKTASDYLQKLVDNNKGSVKINPFEDVSKDDISFLSQISKFNIIDNLGVPLIATPKQFIYADSFGKLIDIRNGLGCLGEPLIISPEGLAALNDPDTPDKVKEVLKAVLGK